MVTFVRDGKKVWPCCPECGCRLETHPNGVSLGHFRGTYPKDARGCLCKYYTVWWIKQGDTWLGSTTNWRGPQPVYNNIPLG